MKTRIQKKVESLVKEVNEDWHLFGEREKLIVGVTGSKESLALVKVLNDIGQNVTAVYVSYDPEMSASFEDWCLQFGEFVSINGKKPVNQDNLKDPCDYCKRSRKIDTYNYATQTEFSTIAISLSREDIVENMLKGLFFNTKISNLKPKTKFFEVNMIYPFFLVPQYLLDRYCIEAGIEDHFG